MLRAIIAGIVEELHEFEPRKLRLDKLDMSFPHVVYNHGDLGILTVIARDDVLVVIFEPESQLNRRYEYCDPCSLDAVINLVRRHAV